MTRFHLAINLTAAAPLDGRPPHPSARCGPSPMCRGLAPSTLYWVIPALESTERIEPAKELNCKLQLPLRHAIFSCYTGRATRPASPIRNALREALSCQTSDVVVVRLATAVAAVPAAAAPAASLPLVYLGVAM